MRVARGAAGIVRARQAVHQVLELRARAQRVLARDGAHDPVAVRQQEAGLVGVRGLRDALHGGERVARAVDDRGQLAGVAGAALVLHQAGAGVQVARRGRLGGRRARAGRRRRVGRGLRVAAAAARHQQHGRERGQEHPPHCAAQLVQDGLLSSVTPTRMCSSHSSAADVSCAAKVTTLARGPGRRRVEDGLRRARRPADGRELPPDLAGVALTRRVALAGPRTGRRSRPERRRRTRPHRARAARRARRRTPAGRRARPSGETVTRGSATRRIPA